MNTAGLIDIVFGSEGTVPDSCEAQLELIRLAQCHGVCAFLRDAGSDSQWFPEAQDFLSEICREQALRSLAQCAALKEILAVFKERRLAALPVKGPVLSQLLYGASDRRPSSDLDLLVDRQQASEVYDALQELGYDVVDDEGPRNRPEAVAMHLSWNMGHRETGVLLDVAQSVLPPLFAGPFDAVYFNSHARVCAFQGEAVELPTPEVLFLFLAHHAARHRGERLMWLLDLRTLLAQTPDFDGPACRSLARRCRMERALDWACRWLTFVTGEPSPCSDHSQPNGPPAGLTWIDDVPPPSIAADYRNIGFLIGLQDGFRESLIFLWRKTFQLNYRDWMAAPPGASPVRLQFLRLLRITGRFFRYCLGNFQ